MNTGIFGEGFPYSNFHNLNMDWIIKIAKDFLDQYTHIQEIIEQGETDIQELTESGLGQLQDKADTLEGLLQAWYEEHSEDIADELADALDDLNTWYTTHEGYLDQTLEDNKQAFDTHAEEKAAQTIASIPDDYTTLSNNVVGLLNATQNNGILPLTEDRYWTDDGGTTVTRQNFAALNLIEPIPVVQGDFVYIDSRGWLIADTYYVVDEDYTVLQTNGSNSQVSGIIEITSATAKWLLVNVHDSFVNTYKVVKDSHVNLLKYFYQTSKQIAGYNYTTGRFWQSDGTDITLGIYANLNAIELINVKKGDKYFIRTWGMGTGRTYFIADSSMHELEHGGNSVMSDVLEITQNDACYLCINCLTSFLPNLIITKYTNALDIENIALEKIISCTGDSTTEGMALTGNHTATYGLDPYPAWLTTLLWNNGYYNYKVLNQGHGGERTSAISTRIGGYACILTEDITIPSDNTPVDITGKMYIYDNDDPYSVFYAQVANDTDPVMIDGTAYNLTIANNTDSISKVTPDGVQTTIPKGTVVFVNDNRNPYINIMYYGINDGNALSLEYFINAGLKNGAVNGNKYIILGCTNPIWNNWSDVIGTTDAEKYEYYKSEVRKAFGIHYIDLYDEFYRHALDYCLAYGFFTDKTEQELTAMRTLLNNHVMPAEFSYDGQHQGNVHLSREGYYVVALLIFNRMKDLKYI